jgi:predicted DNA-binding transcriptional regulator AlpA
VTQEQILENLYERLSRLEAAPPRRNTYNQKQAAERLGISAQTLMRRHAAGMGPKRTKINRNWSYRDEDIEAYIAAQSDSA